MDSRESTTSRTDDAGVEIPYQRFRPKRYQPRMSIFWWIHKKVYLRFIIRELTSVFVAIYAVILIVKLNALLRGPESWEVMTAALATPFSIVLHVIILLFVVYHSITWFLLAPTATVVRLGRKRIPDSAIIAVNFLMWLVLSVAVGWIILAV